MLLEKMHNYERCSAQSLLPGEKQEIRAKKQSIKNRKEKKVKSGEYIVRTIKYNQVHLFRDNINK